MLNNQQNTADKIKCPECGKIIPITETLQHQLTESVRKEYEEKISAQEDAFSEREKQITARAKELDGKDKGIEERVQESIKVEIEKQKVVLAQEARKAAEESLAVEIKDLRENLKTKDKKLEEAHETELTLRRRERELEERAKEIELEVARKMDVERKRVEEQTARRIIDEHRLKDAEKDKKLQDVLRANEELQRKLQQGSQQTQGEVLELEIERLLRDTFPHDEILPVPKGIRGADVLQLVRSNAGYECGTILWESKRTKKWSEGWISKLKDDQREAKADVAVIVTTALPQGVHSFVWRAGVLVVGFNESLLFSIALLLRSQLLEIANIKGLAEHKDERIEVLFTYLTGPQFRQRVDAIIQGFRALEAELQEEKRTTERRWARREKRLNQVIKNTAGMYGDVQGLIGSSMQTIPALTDGESKKIEAQDDTQESALFTAENDEENEGVDEDDILRS